MGRPYFQNGTESSKPGTVESSVLIKFRKAQLGRRTVWRRRKQRERIRSSCGPQAHRWLACASPSGLHPDFRRGMIAKRRDIEAPRAGVWKGQGFENLDL